jgi:hypothetical protein
MMAPRCELTLQGSDEKARRTTITLERAKVIGRDAACDIRLDSRSVSSRHASVRWSDGRLEVRDLGSSFGTFEGKSRIDDWTVVASGAVVWIGDTSLRFDLVWSPIPTPVYFTSSQLRSAFTIAGDSDLLSRRDLVDFPDLQLFLPLRFVRMEGAITSVLDGNGAVHAFESGRLTLGTVELALLADDDSMASLLAPISSTPAESELPSHGRAALVSARLAEQSIQVSVADVADVEPIATERPVLDETVPKGTPSSRTGVDWSMVLMGIAVLIALGAFAAWIL